MEQIRITKGIEVCVNDDGDTINIAVESNEFLMSYKNLLDTLESISKELEEEGKKTLTQDEEFEITYNTSKRLIDEVDKVFGEGSCKKIFGDITPTVFAFIEFFEQMTPIVERYADERNKKIGQKYSTERRGGKKNV